MYAELATTSAKLNAEGYSGGFVVAAVSADDIRTASDLGEQALEEDGYEILDIDKVIELDPVDWEHDKGVGDIGKQTGDGRKQNIQPIHCFGALTVPFPPDPAFDP